ncbi:hypothetical protein [Vibrio parahaemolyticus]|uniref:hypothetical protein n=1 Tax=Vibrio parahaemolyticus TaxID=670 RepID=UPI0004A383D0|nr:hypothetical protein [Vibrio parahaemolyticus]KON55880.1 hypothetical protein ACX02_12770 [Vibrio parahaemolyticus]KZW04923.1 hypothetical protein APF57_10420 [Vibrio parahaemolyticus]KZW09307.1 hypothetical protein APF56_05080 [Vibrio parahaemolyticus]KZW11256.1 hypothetical protein APF58_22055 [Vibrio parahaemolyticus]KZW25388.1 hypothetical protein APF60_21710 [Vibrio parahaemolyticus]
MKFNGLSSKALFMLAVTSSLFSICVRAAECDKEYEAFNARLLNDLKSEDVRVRSSANAQRDCLTLELIKLNPGDDICPTFRGFEAAFLRHTPQVQATFGLQCSLALERIGVSFDDN